MLTKNRKRHRIGEYLKLLIHFVACSKKPVPKKK